jgi:hypothetical protein
MRRVVRRECNAFTRPTIRCPRVIDDRFDSFGCVVRNPITPRSADPQYVPGFFIVTSIYMISEKANDAILADTVRSI